MLQTEYHKTTLNNVADESGTQEVKTSHNRTMINTSPAIKSATFLDLCATCRSKEALEYAMKQEMWTEAFALGANLGPAYTLTVNSRYCLYLTILLY